MATFLAARVVVSDPDPSPPIAFTWEDGPEITNDELVARTARIIEENS